MSKMMKAISAFIVSQIGSVYFNWLLTGNAITFGLEFAMFSASLAVISVLTVFTFMDEG